MSIQLLIAAAKTCDGREIQHAVNDCGIGINVQDGSGNTALHWLAYASSNAMLGAKVMEAISMALLLGASRDVCNQEGMTPVHVAARLGSRVALKALLHNMSTLRESRLTMIAQSFSPVINAIKQFMGADRATLFLVDEKRKKLTASVATLGNDFRSGTLEIDLAWDQGLIGHCLQTVLEDDEILMNQKPKKWVHSCSCKCKTPLRVMVSAFVPSPPPTSSLFRPQ
jgi:hypothetical protein